MNNDDFKTINFLKQLQYCLDNWEEEIKKQQDNARIELEISEWAFGKLIREDLPFLCYWPER